jgi:hypothetical protein
VTEARLWRAQKKAEDLWRPLKKRQQQGLLIQSRTQRAHAASRQAERLLDEAIEIETAWREVCSALEWFSPEGDRNTSAAARAKLDEWLPKLRGHEWKKTVRLLSRPESLTFLDRVEERITQLNLAADDLETALRLEWLRRHPGLLSGESSSSVERRAVRVARGGSPRVSGSRRTPGCRAPSNKSARPTVRAGEQAASWRASTAWSECSRPVTAA